MSMHKKPLTPVEHDGLTAHGLDIGTPSQLSDAFRQGVAWGIESEKEKIEHAMKLLREVNSWLSPNGNIAVSILGRVNEFIESHKK